MHILQIISRKESYGYKIWKALYEEFEAELKIPTVYQHLSELESAGLLTQSRSEQVFRKTVRNYYRLTEKGKSVLIQSERLTT